MAALTDAKVALLVVTPRGAPHQFVSTGDDTSWVEFESGKENGGAAPEMPRPVANMARQNTYIAHTESVTR